MRFLYRAFSFLAHDPDAGRLGDLCAQQRLAVGNGGAGQRCTPRSRALSTNQQSCQGTSINSKKPLLQA